MAVAGCSLDVRSSKSEVGNHQYLPFGDQEHVETVVKQLLLSKPVI